MRILNIIFVVYWLAMAGFTVSGHYEPSSLEFGCAATLSALLFGTFSTKK